MDANIVKNGKPFFFGGLVISVAVIFLFLIFLRIFSYYVVMSPYIFINASFSCGMVGIMADALDHFIILFVSIPDDPSVGFSPAVSAIALFFICFSLLAGGLIFLLSAWILFFKFNPGDSIVALEAILFAVLCFYVLSHKYAKVFAGMLYECQAEYGIKPKVITLSVLYSFLTAVFLVYVLFQF